MPDTDCHGDRNDQSEGFVEESDPDHATPKPGPENALGQGGFTMQQEQGKREKEPEGLRGACEKNPPVPIGAEEAEEEKGRRDAERGVTGASPAHQQKEPRCQQRVEDIGGA